MTNEPTQAVITPDAAVVVDPSDLPVDVPAGDDGNDRDNDLPDDKEQP